MQDVLYCPQNERRCFGLETYTFHKTFRLGSLQITPVHVRIEQLRPVIAAHRHANTSYEIHYTAQGRGSVTVDGRAYDVGPDTVYITGPGVVHTQYTDPDSSITEYCLYLECRRSGADDAFAAFADTHFWMDLDGGRIFPLLRQLIEENRAPQPDTAEMCELLIKQIIVQLSRAYRSNCTAPQDVPPQPLLPADFLPVMEDAFFYRYQTLTVHELAQMLHLSVRQTQRLLRAHFGKTFSQKLTEARMAAASQYLRSTALSVTQISEQLGYASMEYFSAAFRRSKGMSPSAFRKQFCRQKNVRPLGNGL